MVEGRNVPNVNESVAVEGFAELQRALRRIADGVQPEFTARLRAIGEHVKGVERGLVSHKTGRHGPGPTIEGSLALNVTQRGASIYTTAPHGGAINVGANVGARRGPHINRADASHYADRAVRDSQGFVEQEIEAVGNWLLTEFER